MELHIFKLLILMSLIHKADMLSIGVFSESLETNFVMVKSIIGEYQIQETSMSLVECSTG